MRQISSYGSVSLSAAHCQSVKLSCILTSSAVSVVAFIPTVFQMTSADDDAAAAADNNDDEDQLPFRSHHVLHGSPLHRKHKNSRIRIRDGL